MDKRFKWTDEMLCAAALLFDTRTAFKKGNNKAYRAAQSRGILDKVCASIKPQYTYWTDEMIAEEADKYQTRTEFAKNSSSAYSIAHSRNIIDKVCQHMKPLMLTWSDEMLFAAAVEFKTRSEFRSKNNKAYQIAVKRGIIDKVCAHMDYQITYWTDEMLVCAAKNYSTRGEFQKGSIKAYNVAHNRWLLNIICSHMKNPPLMTEWTNEMIFEAATKYNTRWEFQKGDQAAYFAAFRRGIVDQICINMERGVTGFNPDEPGSVYVVALDSITKSYIGFGISNDSKYRLNQHVLNASKHGFSLAVLKVVEFENGKDAADLELKLKRNLPIVDTGLAGFRTEAVLASDHNKLEDMLYDNSI